MTSINASPSFFQRYSFWLLLISAAVIREIPLISLPFNWLESYFHELSHGLVALVSGGNVLSIQLFPNGAGLCTTQGGSRFFISFMGYTGAAIFGAVLYSLANVNIRTTQVVVALNVALLVLSTALWVRDLLTLIILVVLIGLFFAKFKLGNSKWFGIGLQLTGLTVLLNALFSPFYLVDGRHRGDGAALASLTGIPEIVWVVVWTCIAVAFIYMLAKRDNK
ncbi:MAG: M50 family metallopeptidase [Thalassotalea sp.]|nr:M50 family metallopeptidase [Thalassotalea sp.]